MQSLASSLEGLPKGLSAHWETHLRTFENVPSAVTTLWVSADAERGLVAVC